MTIEYTHRTADGRKARIVCDNRISDGFPIIALIYNEEMAEESLMVLGANLSLAGSSVGSEYQNPFLYEKSIWDDVTVDTPVWVRVWIGETSYEYRTYHFAKYSNRRIKVWNDGCTSHTIFSNGIERSTCEWPAEDVFLEKPSDA
jgi:hypothetical protein